MSYPEIVDFGVLEMFRRKGIGTKLMDIAEQISSEYADTVYPEVGLHSGYGSAQRMYVKRGYIPDGNVYNAYICYTGAYLPIGLHSGARLSLGYNNL